MLCLWWLITGKSVAGTPIRDPSQNVTRVEALRMYTMGSAWFTFAEKRKGSIEPGKLADLAVLNADYLTVPEDQIRSIEAVLTMVGGRVVYAASLFSSLEGKYSLGVCFVFFLRDAERLGRIVRIPLFLHGGAQKTIVHNIRWADPFSHFGNVSGFVNGGLEDAIVDETVLS